MEKTIQIERQKPLFKMREGGELTKEGYLQEALELPWLPSEPRVKREKLLVELKNSLERKPLSVICTPKGSGATSLACSVANMFRMLHEQVFYVSLAHFMPNSYSYALRFIRKKLLQRGAKQKRIYLFLDDVTEMTEEAQEQTAYQLTLMQNIVHVLMIMRPKAALLLESLDNPALFYPEDLSIAYDEISLFWPHKKENPEDLKARIFFAHTKGLAVIADACYKDFVRKSQRKRRFEKIAMQAMQEELLAECEIAEEKSLAAAMLLLKQGTFLELKQLGLRHVFETLEEFSKMHTLLGINMALETFATFTIPLSLSCVRKIETLCFSMFLKSIAYLLEKKRITEALFLIRNSARGFENEAFVNLLRTLDPILLFDAAGSEIFGRVYKKASELEKSSVVLFLLQETHKEKDYQKTPSEVIDFVSFRKSMRTARKLPHEPSSQYFYSYFEKHFKLVRTFASGNPASMQLHNFSLSETNVKNGIIEKFVEAELLATKTVAKGVYEATTEEAFEAICGFFEIIREEKLQLYVAFIREFTKLLCGDFSYERDSFFENVSSRAIREKDWVIVACALFAKAIWNYKHDFFIISTADTQRGIHFARKASIPHIEQAFLCLLTLNSFHVSFTKEEETSIFGEENALCLIHHIFCNIQKGKKIDDYAKALSFLEYDFCAGVLIYLAVEKNDVIRRKFWSVLPEKWQAEYKRRFVKDVSLAKNLITPQKRFNLTEHEAPILFGMSAQTPNLLEIHFFGGYQVVLGGQVVQPNQFRRNAAKHILGMLALEETHRISRTLLHERLWPERSVDKAKSSLYAALSNLRGALGDNKINMPHLICEKEYVYLNMDNTLVDLDVLQEMVLEITTPQLEPHECIAKTRKALALYGMGLHKELDHPLYNLLFLKDKAVKAQFVDALVVAIEAAENAGFLNDCLLFSRKAHELIPSREDLFKKYAEALRANNRISEAEAETEKFAKRYIKDAEQQGKVFSHPFVPQYVKKCRRIKQSS